ncbi:MAG: hypothetical protein ACRCS5_08100 [Sphingomonas sp.]|uniref:hypothetical protein n=1 Tax=Sphingomonas sp. TaxID=28214 RepID=UPI003F2DA37B
MGPTLIFDKSFLQSLNVDEAVMLDQMFCCVITPLFFVETMADLAKDTTRGRTAEQIVGGLAERTPVVRSYVNAYHQELILDDLLGNRITMDGRPALPEGIPVRVEGKTGVVYKKSHEADAFERWQRGRFSEVERITAQLWRDALSNLDLTAISKAYRSTMRREFIPKSHEEARALARNIIDSPNQNYRALMLAHTLLELPPAAFKDIVRAWRAAGARSLRDYAPFAAHCLEVDLYFSLALSNGIIGDRRASNKIDITYLHYLPFAQIFVSNDRLHRSTVPLLLGPNQHFVWGQDLKASLCALNATFQAMPDEAKAMGLFKLADRPPVDDTGLCGELWDKCMQGWRKPRKPIPELTPEQHAKIVGDGDRFRAAANRGPTTYVGPLPPSNHFDNVLIERAIPRQRGSWRMFSAEIEKSEDELNVLRRETTRLD